MQDGIIKGTGNSRFLKGAGWPNSYAEFKTMAEAGTLPIDLNGINSAGWQQLATALSKGNLLSDTTAAKLDNVSTPDAAFDLLSRFNGGLGNEYVWRKSKHTEVFTDYASTNIVSSTGNTTIYYGNTSALGSQTAVASTSQITAACAGHYFKVYGNDTLYYGNPSGVCTVSNGYFVFPAKTFISASDEILYVNSSDSNAYPPTESDGYTYTLLGQIGNKVQIATGSYTGTGTYGPGNENSIIAAFKIKLAVIGSGDGPYVLVWHTGVTVTNGGFNGSSNFSLATSISADEKTLAWYNTTSAYNQLNNSGASYPYILIGV